MLESKTIAELEVNRINSRIELVQAATEIKLFYIKTIYILTLLLNSNILL